MLRVSASSETGYEAVAVEPQQAKAILDKLEDPLVRTLVILVASDRSPHRRGTGAHVERCGLEERKNQCPARLGGR